MKKKWKVKFFTLILVLISYCCSSQRITLNRACSFDKLIDSTFIQDTTGCQPSVENTNLILDMKKGLGKKKLPLIIACTDTSSVSYAVVGVTVINKVQYNCIVINQQNLDDLNDYSKVAVLGHEIGHINNGDFNNNEPITSANELGADYYSGFSSAIFKFNSLDSVLEPFQVLDSDATHPVYEIRKKAIQEGWEDGHGDFNITARLRVGIIGYPPTKSKVSIAELLRSNLDLIEIITPLKAGFFRKEGVWFQVMLKVVSTSPGLLNKDVYDNIKSVTYHIIDPTFRHPFVTITDKDQGFPLPLKIYDDGFWVSASITFKDGSMLNDALEVEIKIPAFDKQ